MIKETVIREKMREIIPVLNFIPSERTKEYLESIGVDLTGKRCSICGSEISLNNIGLIFERNGDILFVCSTCLRKHRLFDLYNMLIEETNNK